MLDDNILEIIDSPSFYEEVTGYPNALPDLFGVSPIIITDLPNEAFGNEGIEPLLIIYNSYFGRQ